MTDVQVPIEELAELESERRQGGARRWLSSIRSVVVVPALALLGGLLVCGRCGYRMVNEPTYRNYHVGFRPARTVP